MKRSTVGNVLHLTLELNLGLIRTQNKTSDCGYWPSRILQNRTDGRTNIPEDTSEWTVRPQNLSVLKGQNSYLLRP